VLFHDQQKSLSEISQMEIIMLATVS